MSRLVEHHFATAAELAASFAAVCAGRLRVAIETRGHASLALSGGRTPALLYPVLAEATLDWSRVICTLTDERWVPPEHAESNERAIRSYLRATPAGQATLVGLRGVEATPEAGLSAAERALESVPKPFDLVHLGLGPDGHIASLFPNETPPIPSPLGWLVAAPATPVHGPRISLSLAILAEARTIVLAFTGAKKAAVFEAARAGRLQPTHPLDRLLRSGVLVDVFASP